MGVRSTQLAPSRRRRRHPAKPHVPFAPCADCNAPTTLMRPACRLSHGDPLCTSQRQSLKTSAHCLRGTTFQWEPAAALLEIPRGTRKSCGAFPDPYKDPDGTLGTQITRQTFPSESRFEANRCSQVAAASFSPLNRTAAFRDPFCVASSPHGSRTDKHNSGRARTRSCDTPSRERRLVVWGVEAWIGEDHGHLAV